MTVPTETQEVDTHLRLPVDLRDQLLAAAEARAGQLGVRRVSIRDEIVFRLRDTFGPGEKKRSPAAARV